MVTCRLYGRAGNQLFQIATTLSVAWDNGADALFPDRTLNMEKFPHYFKSLLSIKNAELIRNSFLHKEDNNHSYKPIRYISGMCLDGYFQDYRYFDKHRSRIQDIFSSKEDPINYVAVHVRRGDYLNLQELHPVLNIDYYIDAMNKIGIDNRFMVFSDDMEYCKRAFSKFQGIDVSFSEGKTEIEDLHLISRCSGGVIMANSTFSWWGAYLNKNRGAKIIMPSVWFGVKNSHIQTEGLYMKDWEVI